MSNPTAREDLLIELAEAGLKTLHFPRYTHKYVSMIELGVVAIHVIDGSIEIQDDWFDMPTITGRTVKRDRYVATIGPDADPVYEGPNPGEAVAALIARYALEVTRDRLADLGHAKASNESRLPRDWRCPTCKRYRGAASVRPDGLVTCAAGHESY